MLAVVAMLLLEAGTWVPAPVFSEQSTCLCHQGIIRGKPKKYLYECYSIGLEDPSTRGRTQTKQSVSYCCCLQVVIFEH